MADYEERSLEDLTEEASPHRLEELRQKGQVAQSRELSGTIGLLGIMLAMYFLSSRFISECSSLMKEIFTTDLLYYKTLHQDAENWKMFTEIGIKCGKLLFLTFFPIGFAGMLFGVLSTLAQIGFIFTFETLSPDFERVNPIAGFGKLFSLKSLTEGLKSILKFTVIGVVVYSAIESRVHMLPNIVSFGAQQLLLYIGQTTSRVFGAVAVMLFAVGGFDYWIQWRRFKQQSMMTKAEAKKELKEREGDPQIKARIRTIQRETARKRMMKAVPKADVVITNPTHIAIAIVYDPEEGFAPKVVAKGADFLAERIKKIARENGVPTVENKPLARTLYKYVKVGQMIPRSLYQAVAEILAYVYKLKSRKLKF